MYAPRVRCLDLESKPELASYQSEVKTRILGVANASFGILSHDQHDLLGIYHVTPTNSFPTVFLAGFSIRKTM